MEKTEENNINTSLAIPQPSIAEFKEIIKDIAKNPNVLALKERAQHKNASRYYHCISVSYYTYYLCKKLKLDYVSAARGAMLHDFYFYDWRDKHVEGQKKFHAFRHPRIALNNAEDIFDLNDLEKDIILKHMWPLTIIPPAYKESYIVTLVDKYCATNEMFKKRMRNKKHHNNNKLLESTNKTSEIEIETKENESEIKNTNNIELKQNESEPKNNLDLKQNESEPKNNLDLKQNEPEPKNNLDLKQNEPEPKNASNLETEKDER